MTITIQGGTANVVIVRTMLAALAETLRIHIIDRHHVQLFPQIQHLLVMLLPPCNHLDLHLHHVLALLLLLHHHDTLILMTTIKQSLLHILSLLLPLDYHVLPHALSNLRKFLIITTINSSTNVHDHHHHTPLQIPHLHHYYPSTYPSLQSAIS